MHIYIYIYIWDLNCVITEPADRLALNGARPSLSGMRDLFDRNKILSGGDLSHYQVPHCIRVFFYFV